MVQANRVRQTVIGSGTGDLTVGSAVDGYRTVQDGIGTDTAFEATLEADGTWEIGKWQVTAAGLLQRLDTYGTSTGGAIDWAAGDKTLDHGPVAGTLLDRRENLADLPDTAAARTNLGLGTAAVRNTGTGAGQVPVLDGTGKLPAAIVPPSDMAFADLSDAPPLAGNAGRVLVVNETEDGVALADAPSPSFGSMLNFDSSGTFVVPAGVTRIRVRVWGGGGGGGGEKVAGSNGGTSSFGAALSATGGLGGGRYSPSIGGGGGGGAGGTVRQGAAGGGGVKNGGGGGAAAATSLVDAQVGGTGTTVVSGAGATGGGGAAGGAGLVVYLPGQNGSDAAPGDYSGGGGGGARGQYQAGAPGGDGGQPGGGGGGGSTDSYGGGGGGSGGCAESVLSVSPGAHYSITIGNGGAGGTGNGAGGNGGAGRVTVEY